MADVKRFTGFIAVDGSTHTSAKAAIEHSRVVKTQAALKDKFGNLMVVETGDSEAGVSLDDFIYANRDSILASLNQEVLTRKKRTPKVKVAAAEAAEVTEEVVA